MTTRSPAIDWMVAAYAIVAGAALLFPHRPAGWPLVLAGHVALLALALLAARARPVLERPDARGWLRTAVDWYPLVVVPLLYSELDLLNASVWDGRFFDALILEAEQRLFGGQPSATLARSAPWLALSEFLHGSYISYYALIFVPPLVLYLRGARREFHGMLRPLVLAFLLHYLVFIYFPVQGPRYLFPAPGGDIAGGPMYRLAHAILESGSSRGAAFPSSHMAIGVVQTVATFRFLPRAAPVVLIATLGLGVGAVYGGFHYAIDMIVGAVTGLAIAVAFLVHDRGGRARPDSAGGAA